EQAALTYALPPPPGLRLETAEALNKAFAEERPLEDLLKQHRRLALARASLPARLAVFRKIRCADPGNPVWEEDISKCEGARFSQIRELVGVAESQGDLDTLFYARDEMYTTPWYEEPPKALVQLVERLTQTWYREKLLLDMQRAAQRLATAYHNRQEQEA